MQSIIQSQQIFDRVSAGRMVCAQTKCRQTTKSQPNVCAHDDWDLVRRIIGGDQDAFVNLIDAHKKQISQTVSRYAYGPADRDILVNETFAEVYFCIEKFRGDSNLATWITTIATRLCYKHLKRKERDRKRRELLQRIGWERNTIYPPPTRHSDTARDHLESIMGTISTDDRMVLTLLYWEDCSMSETARRLDWSESKTKVRAHRARARLKRAFGDRNHE